MKLALFYSGHANTLSYQDDWLDAFLDIDAYVKAYDLRELSIFQFHKVLKEFDYVIFLHSTNSNGFQFRKLLGFFANFILLYRKCKIIFFVGNEYKLMPEKINFLIKNNIDFVVSQLPIECGNWLYKKTNAKIISLPHALNTKYFYPKKDLNNRKIDIGNRSYEYPKYLGDNIRSNTTRLSQSFKNKFKIDVSTNPSKRFSRLEWAKFLNDCKYTISCEVGSSFLERDDYTRKTINKYYETGQKDKVFEYFNNYTPPTDLSGKAIGGRHFDAIGTKTCQILIEGKYSDILKANIHYIELKNDFSNVEEIIELIKDDKIRKTIVEQAYQYIIDKHQYKHRIKDLLSFM